MPTWCDDQAEKERYQAVHPENKENIYDVDIQEFERLVSSTYNLLEEEYGIMKEIRDMIIAV